VASLIIKVTKDGSSREYLFNKLGPILIGTEENSDIRIEDDQLEGKILEVKLSSGNIFIKELALKAEVFLDSVILPYREETSYKQGETISLAQSHYQIQIFKVGEEAPEPPPFFTDDFKLQLEELKRKIKDKEDQLHLAERQLEKKRSSIEDVDAGIRVQLNEKNKRELEIDFLKKKQYEINQELDKKRDQINQEQNSINVLKEHVHKLGHEDKALSENILRHESTLFRLKGDIERSHLEIKDFREKIAGLELEEKKKLNSLADIKRDSDEISQQTVIETQRLNALLAQTDQSLKEKRKLEVKIEILKKEIDDNSRTLDQVQSMMDDQQKIKRESEAKLQTLGFEIERSEHLIIKIREDILLEQGKEKQLKNLNKELRADLAKIEEKLVSKKNQYNQLDYQTQDSLKNLSNLKIEIEKSDLESDILI
jgi:chromosome segregation ATPase